MTLQFRQGQCVYDITIARGALLRAAELFDLKRKILVVTGEGVPQQYAKALLSQCPEGWFLTIPEGEANKTPASVEFILNSLLEHGFTRGDAVVAVGGGVTGDTAGFAAACYMRGIDWYNVPTTLLSQADSSIGGKTGVNLQGVKNIVGAFHQPSGVIIDPDTLDTLSPRLFAEGLAEIIKMAATSDATLFETLENAEDLRPIMEQVLASALSIKLAVVEADPTEKGLRAVLNFGHTIGHAIEGASGCENVTSAPEAAAGTETGTTFGDRGRPWPREWEGPAPLGVGGMSPEGAKVSGGSSGEVEAAASVSSPTSFYHGEAVAIGMLYMAEEPAKSRIEKLLKKYGLPTEDPFTTEQLLHFAAHDKKRKGGSIKTVRVSQPGSFRFEEATQETLRSIIQARKI